MFVQVARDYQAATDGEVHERLRHRHHLARSPDDHRRPPVRSPGVVARRQQRARCAGHSDAAGAERAGGAGRLQVEQHHAARRHHLRGRRSAQDRGPRQLRDVRVAAAGRLRQVRVADSVLLRLLQRGGPERRRHRAAERDPVQPGAAGLHGLRSDQPGPALDREHRRPERQGADHPRVPDRHGQGAVAELLGQRHLHLPQDGRSDLGSADRASSRPTTRRPGRSPATSPSSAPSACRSTV